MAIRRLPALFVAATFLFSAVSNAQPRAVTERIPADMPPEVRELVKLLYSRDAEAREYAGRMLQEMKETRVVEYLIAGLRGRNFGYGGTEALIAMGELAVDPLIAALRDDDKEVGQFAAHALGRIGDARAVEPLIAALEDEEVKGVAAWALGWIPDSRAVEPLIALLREEDARVRRVALETLGKIGDTRAVQPLIAALEDEDEQVRWTAVSALGEMKDSRAVEALITVLEGEQSQRRWSAAEALGKIGKLAVEPLVASLGSEDWEIRQRVVHALSGTTRMRAFEMLPQTAWGQRETVALSNR